MTERASPINAYVLCLIRIASGLFSAKIKSSSLKYASAVVRSKYGAWCMSKGYLNVSRRSQVYIRWWRAGRSTPRASGDAGAVRAILEVLF